MKNDIRIEDDHAIIMIHRKDGSIHEMLIDLDDVEFVSEYRWSIDGNGYAVSNILKKTLHTILVKGGKSEVIDHRNQNKLDNRKFNLRIASKSLNSINSKMNKNNKTGVKGVFFYKRKNKFIAYLTLNKKRIDFGYFENIEDAIKARLNGELEYFKDNSPQKHLFEKYGIGVD